MEPMSSLSVHSPEFLTSVLCIDNLKHVSLSIGARYCNISTSTTWQQLGGMFGLAYCLWGLVLDSKTQPGSGLHPGPLVWHWPLLGTFESQGLVGRAVARGAACRCARCTHRNWGATPRLSCPNRSGWPAKALPRAGGWAQN